ncbi:hypothetical protein, partial [Nocardia fluminea]|uniref:hypothetical protein n=1 Tax=Nocardia fluminea TaxID=134984 RepID=UPI0033CE391F
VPRGVYPFKYHPFVVFFFFCLRASPPQIFSRRPFFFAPGVGFVFPTPPRRAKPLSRRWMAAEMRERTRDPLRLFGEEVGD